MKKNSTLKLMLFSTMILIFSGMFISCEYEFVEVSEPTEPISFSLDIVPVFSNNGCISCHKTGGKSPDLTAANAYNSIYPSLINLTSPEESIIYTVPGPSSTHPAKLTPAQASQMLAWIKQGAQNN